MPPANTKKATNGNDAPRGKAASRSGTATPVSLVDKKDTSEQLAAFAGGRPDKKLYDAEQEKIKAEIDTLQTSLTAIRDKIALATQSSPGNDRGSDLRAELDTIRDQQSTNKYSRGKVLDQIKALQDNVQKKFKGLQASKTKIHFKSVAEVDAHIKNLDKQVESGSMKLADEKRALQEISTSKRSRRIVEGFQAEQESIDADKEKIEELRKELDDPAAKAVSDRYEAIKGELDQLKKESDEAYAGRSKLFEERDNIQSQLKSLFNNKRESAHRFREANDHYWNKVNEDRARRAERARAQRVAEELQKKQDLAQRLREEAELPAFQAQIEDCQTLIDLFSGKTTGTVTYKSTFSSAKTEVAGVPKLELRKVEENPEGLVARKKKGEEEEAYFISNKGKNKNKKGSTKVNGPASNGSSGPAAPCPSSSINISLPTLSALSTLSISPPVSTADVPRVIEDLNAKKAWYAANQARVTAENIAKAEADIQRLTKDHPVGVTPSEVTAEPASTPLAEIPATDISSTLIDDKLESIQEAESVVPAV